MMLANETCLFSFVFLHSRNFRLHYLSVHYQFMWIHSSIKANCEARRNRLTIIARYRMGIRNETSMGNAEWAME